jgi:hypothetical protein
MISQRDLSVISNDLLREYGGRRIPDQTIELDYALGWFLSELSQSPFANYLRSKVARLFVDAISGSTGSRKIWISRS